MSSKLLLLCNRVTFWPVPCTFYKVLKLVTFAGTGYFHAPFAPALWNSDSDHAECGSCADTVDDLCPFRYSA